MPDLVNGGLRRPAPAPICLAAGILIGVATDDLGLWTCLGVAVGAALTGMLAWESRR